MAGLPYSTGAIGTGPANTVQLTDSVLTATIADAGAGNTVYTNSIDLGAAPYPTTQGFLAQVVIGTATGMNNTKNINAWIQHSSDNGNWTNIPELSTSLVVQACDANGNILTAKSDTVTLPPSTKEYIRVGSLTEANGGTPVGNVTLTLLFFT